MLDFKPQHQEPELLLVAGFEKLPKVTIFKVTGFEEIAKSNNFFKVTGFEEIAKSHNF